MRTRIVVPAIAASLALLGVIFVLAGPALAYPASNAMPSNMTTGSNDDGRHGRDDVRQMAWQPNRHCVY